MCFPSCRPFVVNAKFSTGLVGCVSAASWLGPSQKKLQHPTRLVENVTVNDDRPTGKKTTIEWDDGGKIGNKNK